MALELSHQIKLMLPHHLGEKYYVFLQSLWAQVKMHERRVPGIHCALLRQLLLCITCILACVPLLTSKYRANLNRLSGLHCTHMALQGYMLILTTWCRATSPEERLQEALQNQDAVTACIQQKHFAKSLQSSQLTQPAQLLCGIAESGYVHFMFVYKDPMRDVGFDNDISLSYCLPVRDE